MNPGDKRPSDGDDQVGHRGDRILYSRGVANPRADVWTKQEYKTSNSPISPNRPKVGSKSLNMQQQFLLQMLAGGYQAIRTHTRQFVDDS